MLLRERHEIVLTDSLQNWKHGGRVATIGDEARALGSHRIILPACQTDAVLRFLHEYSECAVDHVERALNVVVVMVWHLLARADLQLGDAKAGPCAIMCAPLDFIEKSCVVHCARDDVACTILNRMGGIVSEFDLPIEGNPDDKDRKRALFFTIERRLGELRIQVDQSSGLRRTW